MNRTIKPFWFALLALALIGWSATGFAQQPRRLAYVGKKTQANTVKLPVGYLACKDSMDSITMTSGGSERAWTSSAPTDAGRDADKAAQCGGTGPATTVEMVGATLRASDVKAFAFDTVPNQPKQLLAILELKTATAPDVVHNTQLKLDGISTPGVFDRSPGPRLVQFRFDDVDSSHVAAPGQLRLVPTNVADPLEPSTGTPTSEFLEAGQNFVTDGVPRTVHFAKPQRTAGIDRVQVTLPRAPLDRFVEWGPVTCGPSAECVVSQSDRGLIIDTAVTNLEVQANRPKLLTSAELKLSAKLFQVKNGALTPVSGLKVVFGVTECLYELTQLTRLQGGMSQAEALFRFKRMLGSHTECSEQEWSVIAKRPGTTEAIASGALTFVELADPTAGTGIASVVWETLPAASPNGSMTYEVGVSYPGGQPVAMAVAPKLLVAPTPEPTQDLRAFVIFKEGDGEGSNAESTERKKIASGRVNHVLLPGFPIARDEAEWKFDIAGASSRFKTCNKRRPTSLANGPSLCVTADRPTDAVLKLRARHETIAESILLPGATLPSALHGRKVNLGYIDFLTGLAAAEYRVASDLRESLSVVCGSRTIDDRAFGEPRSVGYRDFDDCQLVFDPARADRRVSNARQFVDYFGTQEFKISAGVVPTDMTAPELKPLQDIVIYANREPKECAERGSSGLSCFRFDLDLGRAVSGVRRDYTVVHLRIQHDPTRYESGAPRSGHASELVVRIRRRPEHLTSSSDEGNGARLYFTFTVTPFTLFRAPHSGGGIWKSSDAKKLESASFGAGFVAVAEPWDFDRNSAFTPLFGPQLHFGVVSTVPSKTELEPPTFSLVMGGGLRTGVDTSPDDQVESSLKFLVWYERLWTFDEQRRNGTGNLLFGFGADIGSFGN